MQEIISFVGEMQNNMLCLLVCAAVLLCTSACAQAPASGYLTQLQQGVVSANATGGINGVSFCACGTVMLCYPEAQPVLSPSLRE